MTFPKLETKPQRRAQYPSSQSVMAAMLKTIAATNVVIVPGKCNKMIIPGIATMRNRVSRFGGLNIPDLSANVFSFLGYAFIELQCRRRFSRNVSLHLELQK
jgi:hypothetical protein